MRRNEVDREVDHTAGVGVEGWVEVTERGLTVETGFLHGKEVKRTRRTGVTSASVEGWHVEYPDGSLQTQNDGVPSSKDVSGTKEVLSRTPKHTLLNYLLAY